jgi:hypothetical protein
MFGLLDLVTKRVNDQMIEYAAAQSDIARRLGGIWLDPFHAYQPVKILTDRPAHDGRTLREASRRR